MTETHGFLKIERSTSVCEACGGQRQAGTHHVVGLRLADQDQYVGADDGQAEVEQDDGSLRADVSVEQTQKTAEAESVALIHVGRGQGQRRRAVAAFALRVQLPP